MFVCFFYYRILSHNKIRVLKNASFMGLSSLEKLWVSCFVFNFALLLCILFTLDLCNAPGFWPMWATKCITEIWEGFEQLWVHLSTDGLLSSREDDPLRLDITVMLKISHNDALVLLYWVNPTPTRQDKRDLWQEVLCWQFFLQLSDSLVLLHSSVITLKGVWDKW